MPAPTEDGVAELVEALLLGELDDGLALAELVSLADGLALAEAELVSLADGLALAEAELVSLADGLAAPPPAEVLGLADAPALAEALALADVPPLVVADGLGVSAKAGAAAAAVTRKADAATMASRRGTW